MKKYIILIALIIIAALIFLLLHSQTYSLSEVEADTYEKDLKRVDELIWNCGIDDCIPDNISLLLADMYDTHQTNGLKVEKKQTNPTRTRVDISNCPFNLNYSVWFEQSKKGAVAVQIVNWHHSYKEIKTIVDKLILKEGFVLKPSSLIYGRDILVKDNDDDFLIVQLSGHYDGEFPANAIMISTYSKRQYF